MEKINYHESDDNFLDNYAYQMLDICFSTFEKQNYSIFEKINIFKKISENILHVEDIFDNTNFDISYAYEFYQAKETINIGLEILERRATLISKIGYLEYFS